MKIKTTALLGRIRVGGCVLSDIYTCKGCGTVCSLNHTLSRIDNVWTCCDCMHKAGFDSYPSCFLCKYRGNHVRGIG